MKLDRFYYPGSKWLFYKLYCGRKGADELLVNHIYRIVSLLYRQGMIEKWFFIRYFDPDFHVRVRFCLKRQEDVHYVISTMYDKLRVLIKEKIIWKIQIDTYERELERYPNIDNAENVFCIDSDMILHILRVVKQSHEIRWKIAIYIVETYLSFCKYSDEQKILLLEFILNSFKEEFGFDEHNSKSLNLLYRTHRQEIKDIIEGNCREEMFLRCINVTKKSCKILTKYIKDNSSREIIDYIHMSMNRLFISCSKQYELTFYFCLYKYYKSVLFLQKR